MSSVSSSKPIRVGVLIDQPLRLEGLVSIFEDRPGESYAPLSEVVGEIDELLSDPTLKVLVMDLDSPFDGMKTVESIRRRRPDVRLIVIGPEGNDKLILDLIMSGVRGYIDLKATRRIVRQAVEVVTSGSIWAPRRLLSQLVDQMIGYFDTSLTNDPPHLTDRERQVLELILTASSNHEIARQLGIEKSTVQTHVSRLMRKMGANNRVDLLMRSSNPALLNAAGIIDRRQADRRQADRRQADRRQGDRYRNGAFGSPPITIE